MNKMSSKIITIGAATIDTIIEYEDPQTLNLHSKQGIASYLLLEEGKKIEVTTLGQFSGGGGTNSAIAFKKLGFEVSSICRVGQDDQGAHVINELTQAGVETRYIQRDMNECTASSYIIPSLKGDRTILAHRGANGNLIADAASLEAIAHNQYVYISSLSGNSSTQLPLITHAAKLAHVPIAINPGISQLRLGADCIIQSLKDIEIVIVNSSEAKHLMSAMTHQNTPFQLTDFFQLILAQGPRFVVVTDGDKGVHVADKTQIYFHPALDTITVVNTLGAGDAFGSTFVAFIAQGKPVEQAIFAGIINSSCVVSCPDAKTGLLSEQELLQRLREFSTSQLQCYAITHR